MSTARSPRGLFPGLTVVFLVACAVFSRAVTYGFAYDDSWTVKSNPALDSALFPLMKQLVLGRAVAAHVPDATRPWMVLSMWVDHRLFGFDSSGYHLHSLLLYGAASVAAALAVFAIARRRAAAFFGGLFFAAAPVHAEAVAAINYREDLYAAIAMLGGIALAFWPRRGAPSRAEIFAVSLLLGVGLLGKESAFGLLLLVTALATTRGPSSWYTRNRSIAMAMLGVAFPWACWRLWLRVTGRDDVPLSLQHHGFFDRVLRTARYSVEMLTDGLVPLRWSPEYAPLGPASPLWLLALGGAVGAGFWLWKRHEKTLVRGLIVSLLAGLTTSPLVSPINERADRYAFVAVLGGSIVWGSLFARLPAHPQLRRAVLYGATLSFAVLAQRAASPWHDDLSLWRTAVERAPTSARAFTGLSRALRNRGELDAADAAVAHAVALDPTFLRARVAVVFNALARGDVEAARRGIEAVDRGGGSTQQGMKRARKCVALPPPEAMACAGYSRGAPAGSAPVETPGAP